MLSGGCHREACDINWLFYQGFPNVLPNNESTCLKLGGRQAVIGMGGQEHFFAKWAIKLTKAEKSTERKMFWN